MADNLFDDEDAYRQYIDDVNNSQGFYVASDYGRNVIGGIVKINEEDVDRYQRAERAAVFAVDQHNMKENTNLKYMRIVNLNMGPTAGALYYITLAAMEPSGDVNHYRAKVWEKIHAGYQLEFFRLAPYAIRHVETTKEDGSRFDGSIGKLQQWKDKNCVRIGSLEPWMDENYLYHTCFHRVIELVSVKVIRDEQTGESKGFGFLWFENQAAAAEVLNSYNKTQMPNASQHYNLTLAKHIHEGAILILDGWT